jgi:kynureninase
MLHDVAVLDPDDPLTACHDRFYLQPGTIYLDGNSLGLASRDAEASLLRELAAWKRHAIDGRTAAERPWVYTGEQLGAQLTPPVGALPDEVCVAVCRLTRQRGVPTAKPSSASSWSARSIR